MPINCQGNTCASPPPFFFAMGSILGNPCTRLPGDHPPSGLECSVTKGISRELAGHNGHAWVDLQDGLDKPTATFPSFVSIPSSRLALLPILMPRLAIARNKELLLTPTPCFIHPNYSPTIQCLQKASNCPADTMGQKESLHTSSLSIKDNTEAASVWVFCPIFSETMGKSSGNKKEVLPCRSFVCLPVLCLFQVLGRSLYHSQIQEKASIS